MGLPLNTCLDRVGRWSPYEIVAQSTDLTETPTHRAVAQNTTAGTAIVIRAWDDCVWTLDIVRNIRAIVAETSVPLPAEYQVTVLLHIRNDSLAYEYRDRREDLLVILRVPEDLHAITRTWSYPEMEAAYPDVGAYDISFHSYMPLQQLVLANPAINHVWNWELVVRYTGHYGHLLTNVDKFASQDDAFSPI
ncbi:hypothetical protein LTR78_006429 [Recurvomyces mirabilis]|uniref:Uncharacterized protein n=1 Tax=Recurvomyces mirabilis TaxID=574656 RepID=A0AAE0WKT0_9PEZI|nr:hypothetical protein LTR78_006429 [Recurvomyces mirabilis]KAK5151154.1 hypothetical protein LTS14_009650 [Recurvomyces mirabilis]